jgi:hypothetical protein
MQGNNNKEQAKPLPVYKEDGGVRMRVKSWMVSAACDAVLGIHIALIVKHEASLQTSWLSLIHNPALVRRGKPSVSSSLCWRCTGKRLRT